MKSNNMKRSAFIIVTFLFIVLAAKGQSIEEIQTSKDYIWGTGNAATLKKADNEALAALISQISTNVSSKFEQLTEGGMRMIKQLWTRHSSPSSTPTRVPH